MGASTLIRAPDAEKTTGTPIELQSSGVKSFVQSDLDGSRRENCNMLTPGYHVSNQPCTGSRVVLLRHLFLQPILHPVSAVAAIAHTFHA